MRGYRAHHLDPPNRLAAHLRGPPWAMGDSRAPVRTSSFSPPPGSASLGPAEATLKVSGLWLRSKTQSPGYSRYWENQSGGGAGSPISFVGLSCHTCACAAAYTGSETLQQAASRKPTPG